MTAGQDAAALVAAVRAGRLDPRHAAVRLGLPFDQDRIMAILELAASAGELKALLTEAFADPERLYKSMKFMDRVAAAVAP